MWSKDMTISYFNRYDKVTFQGVICSAPLLSQMTFLASGFRGPGPHAPPHLRSPRSWVHPEHLPWKTGFQVCSCSWPASLSGESDPNATPQSPAGASTTSPSAAQLGRVWSGKVASGANRRERAEKGRGWGLRRRGGRGCWNKGMFSLCSGPPFFFILFIYFWLPWVSVAVHRLSLVAVSNSWLRRVGFLLRRRLLVRSMRSRSTGFSSCSPRAQQLWRKGLGALRHVESSRTRD